MNIKKVCVYCASSNQCDPVYSRAAKDLGKELARKGITIIYGGGANGLMGKLADAALTEGGEVIGILPKFMIDMEWGHENLTKLVLVDTLHDRKRMMIEDVDAIIALPGGCGTLEELLESITLKRLGIYFKPIIIVNINGFYDHLLGQLDHSIGEHFMRPQHREMWTVIDKIENVIETIINVPSWDSNARSFAAL